MNLPGGGGVAPFEENTLREVKWLSYVNEVSKIIGTVVRNPTEFCKETKELLTKTVSRKRRVSNTKGRLNPQIGHFVL